MHRFIVQILMLIMGLLWAYHGYTNNNELSHIKSSIWLVGSLIVSVLS